jgi:histidine triad (HIT) family protein
MDDCIFCKIVRGEIPSFEVYQDDDYFAFLDIFPRVEGHTMVIPKKHHTWVYEVDDFSGFWDVALKITKGMQKALGTTYVNYFTYGAVPHAHIHILPRHTQTSGDALDSDIIPPHMKEKPGDEKMQEIANHIKSSIIK